MRRELLKVVLRMGVADMSVLTMVEPDKPLPKVLLKMGCVWDETPEDVNSMPVYVFRGTVKEVLHRALSERLRALVPQFFTPQTGLR